MADDFLYNGGLELEQSSQPASSDSSNSRTEASAQDAKWAPDASNRPASSNLLSENWQSPEDLDPCNPVEPPLLNWRSGSFSEPRSAVGLENCSVGDLEASGSLNTELNEDMVSAVSDYGAQDSSEELSPQEMCENKPEVCVFQQQDEQQKPKENYVEDRDRKLRNYELKKEKIRDKSAKQDIDHSHIQSLLTQLHLFHPSINHTHCTPDESANHGAPHKSYTPAEATACSFQELEFTVQSACGDADRNVPEALLFSHEYQKDLLQLLEEPESERPRSAPLFVHTPLVTPGHQSGLRGQSSEAEEMISVSHSKDAWHRHLQEELLVSGITEEEQSTASKGLSVVQSISPNSDLEAETWPAYKSGMKFSAEVFSSCAFTALVM
ncbi:uncharacterized protein LOC132119287 isoform X1 [Carassius carassius]|uniref:uncharacterized protein LOC132119287 isoform X1 n=1 Tax=Carassius carassius TaxID=217509 RepID=UPI0028696883|nr:uncharacterized protein LOC132119287 isoform X1 [Carassius carassius]